MKALCWVGIDKITVERIPDPQIVNGQDMIVRVRQSATCGSDLPLLDGHVPYMRPGDVLGHEFVGEVVEVGDQVRAHAVGDRVVVSSYVSCGRCWYCAHGLFSCCDNSNTSPLVAELAWGAAPAGGYGHSQATGGFPGSHAEYVRVPYADHSAFRVPDGVDDDRALFASDAAPAGWMAAEDGGVRPGDVVAVWGAGAVGQLAARAAMLLGAERVIVIDRYGYRLRMAERAGCETVHYEQADVGPELRERTGGRGPDVCVEAVGLRAHRPGPRLLPDPVRRGLRMESDRAVAVREAVNACRKGGTVFVLGMFVGDVEGFPLGAVLNKSLTVRGAQQHGPRFVPTLLDRMARGDLVTEQLATHRLPLERGPEGYTLFRDRVDGCVRTVFHPAGV